MSKETSEINPFAIPEKIKISQSAINSFDTCPAKFIMSRNIQQKDYLAPSYFKHGSAVHALMESGEEKPASARRQYDDKVWEAVKTLRDLEKALDVEIIHREENHTIEFPNGIQLRRIIDGIGILPDGTHILIDYKTAGKKWTTIKVNGDKIAPKAYGWQSVSYLIPPAQEVLDKLGMEEWPTSIYYLVAPGYGNPQMFKVDRDLKREAELHLRIATIKDCYDNETFPKVRGWNCERCQYFKPCWNVAGWEEEFEAKRKVAVSEDK